MNNQLKTLRLFLILAVLLAAPPMLAGSAAPVAGDETAWPTRWSGEEGAPLKGVILPLDLPHGLQPIHTARGIVTPSAHDRAAGHALLGDDHSYELQFEGAGSFVYAPGRLRRAAHRRAAEPQLYFKFISGRPDEGTGPRAVKITRTWFAWYDPAARAEAQRGTVLLLPGMLGTPEPIIEHFITSLREEGYGILRMMCQPSRFTERIIFDVDLGEPEPAARAIAGESAERLAECAYAVEAAFAHVAQERPAFAALPRIALGMSGGAMILPTVVAREADKYAAAILIAGGANMMAILEDSNYKHMINAAHISWSPTPPGDEQRRQFDELYLSLAPLDPYHTARRLHGKPMLMLHATHDLAVPAALGDLLWERLGQPERWVEEAGHEEIFMRLPQKTAKIIGWLNSQLAARAD